MGCQGFWGSEFPKKRRGKSLRKMSRTIIGNTLDDNLGEEVAVG